MHDNSKYDENNPRRKRIEKYYMTHEHDPKTGFNEKKKVASDDNKKVFMVKQMAKKMKSGGYNHLFSKKK